MLIPMILSGGAGTRLWPASRHSYPKPFMRVAGQASLLGLTVQRAMACADGGEVLTVTAEAQHFLTLDEYARQPSDKSVNHRFLLEPVGRNTAPAIVLAALDVQFRHGDTAKLLVLPADHLISDDEAFVADVRRAAAVADQGLLVTFGIRPTHPETGFGYIHAGGSLAEGSPGREILAFVEKPDLETAERYLASGEYYWNAGMFCFSVGTLLDTCAKTCPDVLEAARRCYATATIQPARVTFDKEAFAQQPDISIDYAVMERADRRAVVPASFDWSDIGSWKAISELGEADTEGNRKHGHAIMINATNCFVEAGARTIAVVGLEDIIVVDAGDAVLVSSREHSQSVKQVVAQLRQDDHAAAIHHLTVHRPWGSYTVLEDGDDCKVKRLTVKPGGVLSLQKHFRRSEHWTVVSGTAKVRVGEQEFLLERNQSTYIPVDTLHRLENPTEHPLHLIEVQCGDYFGEDDIVRLEDKYGRS